MYDFMSMRKGKMFNERGTNFEVGFVVIDYNHNGVFYINLNSKNTLFRKVKYMSYKKLEKYQEERI